MMSLLARTFCTNIYSSSRRSSYIKGALSSVQCAGMKNFPMPPNYRHVEIPTTRQKLKILMKVPIYPPNVRPMKMPRQRNVIRGEEEVHTRLLYNQYGIVATRGGFIAHSHIEMMRLGLGRKMDVRKMFAIWRIDSPWKPVTRKSPGQALGGGKGNIKHYVTPIREGRIILEMGGKCAFEEVYPMLNRVAHKLPFPAKVVSAEMLEDDAAELKRLAEENTNPYTLKYIFQNHLLGCDVWLKDVDRQYLGKYSRDPV